MGKRKGGVLTIFEFPQPTAFQPIEHFKIESMG